LHTVAQLILALILVLAFAACASRPDNYSIEPDGKRLSQSEAERELVQKNLRVQVEPPLDAPLRPLHVNLPSYPRAWKRLGNVSEMRVTVAFTVSESGTVGKVAIYGDANPDLAALCVTAMRDWRFEPESRGGKAVEVRLSQEFIFRLDD
jgi:TonB family protein